MKAPEEIKKGLAHCGKPCMTNEHGCCPYYADCLIGVNRLRLIKDALAYITQLEETISLMKIQMRGDCGCCAHGKNGDMTLCNKCLTEKEYHPLWEYEGLPEVTGRE